MSQAEEPRAIAYCSWHKGLSDSARLVSLPADQGSGHGTPGLYACVRCRTKYRLTPLGDLP